MFKGRQLHSHTKKQIKIIKALNIFPQSKLLIINTTKDRKQSALAQSRGQLRQHQMKAADNEADRQQMYVPSPGWAVKGCWPSRPPHPAPCSPSPPPGRERRPDQSTCSLGRASWWTGTCGSPLRIHPGKGRKSSWRKHVVCR